MSAFRPNPLFVSELRKQPELRDAKVEAAKEAARHANRIEHGKFMPRKRSGTAKAIVVEVVGFAVRIVNTKHGGHLQEWGSKRNRAQAPLRRGVRAAGLRFRERPKP